MNHQRFFLSRLFKTALSLGGLFLIAWTLRDLPTFGQQKPDKTPLTPAVAPDFDKTVVPFLKAHCYKCHGLEIQKADLGLHLLTTNFKGKDADVWAKVLERLDKREMPPPESKQPPAKDLNKVTAAIAAALKHAGKTVVRHHRVPAGNLVDHAALFDPKTKAPLDNPPRLWRLSPEIYAAFINKVGKGKQGISQPFTAESSGSFKDFAGGKIDEPVAVTLFNNALIIVAGQTAHKIEDGNIKSVGFTRKEFLRLLDPKNTPDAKQIQEAIKAQFQTILSRDPTEKELQRFVQLMQKNIKDAGRTIGVRYTLAAVLLLPEAVYRMELGQGPPDEHGRVRLAPREIAFALAYALTDQRPDNTLLAAADKGELNTREGVAKQVKRMLDEPRLEKPRILRFFREYFGYAAAIDVFKDEKDNRDHDARVLVEDTDKLIHTILDEDRDVFYELMTTNKSFVAYKQADNIKKQRAQALEKFKKDTRPNKKLNKPGKDLFLAYNLKDFPDTQPVTLPKEERSGILTQPSWLVAFSANNDNHPVLRGKWVREKLLGGTVPDLPITVDAQFEEHPNKTLRQRMAKTTQTYCWQCHQKMNPLGLTFEIYDHYGTYRKEELGKPVDASGAVDLTGDPRIEGKVFGAVAMLSKLAKSERAEQVFVRHAFRYWTGRNENLGDAQSLQETYQAYKSSGGSMKALITALLSSDSFLYRSVAIKPKEH